MSYFVFSFSNSWLQRNIKATPQKVTLQLKAHDELHAYELAASF